MCRRRALVKAVALAAVLGHAPQMAYAVPAHEHPNARPDTDVDPCSKFKPNRSITILLPAGAGNSSDAAARALTDEISRRTSAQGTPISFMVENNGTAFGILSATRAAEAEPDGMTLMFPQAPILTVNPFLESPKTKYKVDSFKPVAYAGQMPYVLICNRDKLPNIKKMSDFVNHLKDKSKFNINFAVVKEAVPSLKNAKEEGIFYSHGGLTNMTNLLMVRTLKAAKIDPTSNAATPVYYSSTGQAMTEVAGGHTDCMYQSLASVEGWINDPKQKATGFANKFNIIATTSAEAKEINGVELEPVKKTLPEFGAMENWVGLVAPKGTPDAVVTCLNHQVNEALKDPEVRRKMAKNGWALPTKAEGSGHFEEIIKKDVVNTADTVKLINDRLRKDKSQPFSGAPVKIGPRGRATE